MGPDVRRGNVRQKVPAAVATPGTEDRPDVRVLEHFPEFGDTALLVTG